MMEAVKRWWRPLLMAGWAIVVARLTLAGGSPTLPRFMEIPRLCVLCEGRGTADALLNVALFVPLGLALGRRRSLRAAVLAGFGGSLVIEVAQAFVPGRYPALSDLVWNTTGAGLGYWLSGRIERTVQRYLSDLRRGPRPDGVGRTGRYAGLLHGSGSVPGARADRQGLAWGLVLAAGFLATGVLSTPAPSRDEYWVHWTPRLGVMPQYGGTALAARIGDLPVRPGQIDHAGTDEPLLDDPWSVEATFVVGPAPEGVAPILVLTDGDEREILLMGAHRDDGVLREQTLGRRLGFDSPDVRLPDALATLSPGDTTVMRGSRTDGITCLSVGSDARCGMGITPGRSWGLLLYLEGPREWLRRLVDVGWLAILFAPLGFFSRTWRQSLDGALVAVIGAASAVWLTPMIPGSWAEVLGVVSGVVLGRSALQLLARLNEPGQRSSSDTIASRV